MVRPVRNCPDTVSRCAELAGASPAAVSAGAPRSRLREEVIRDLNPVLRGWGNYFRSGNASRHFTAVDKYVTERVVRLLPPSRAFGPGAPRRLFRHPQCIHNRFVRDFGLHKLLGTIRCPEAANTA